jgi:hypothetical protein
MPAKDAVNPWAQWVQQRLHATKQSDAEFCRAAGLKTSTFAEMKRRKPRNGRVPSREAVMGWAKVLGLPESEWEAFWEETILIYAPASVQELVARLRREAARVGRTTPQRPRR